MLPADESRPSPFQELPDELLLHIFEQLSFQRGPCGEADDEAARQSNNEEISSALHALTLSSRQFNAISTPKLYACVLQKHCQPASIKRLLQTLINEPHLAHHIQYIESFQGPLPSDPAVFSATDLHEYDRCLANSAWIYPWETLAAPKQVIGANPYIRFFGKHLAEMRRDYPPWFAITTLIALAQNLQEAVVHFHGIFRAALAFKQSSPLGGGLQRAWLIGLGSPAQSIVYMLAGKVSKQSNIAQCLLGYDRTEKSYIQAPALEEVSVHASDMDIDYDLPFILNCSALKRFSARWRSVEIDVLSQHGPVHPVDLPKLQSLLSRFETSLTHLEIDTMESSWSVHLDIDIEAFGSFKKFTSLTHLTVTGLVLWGDYEDAEYPRLSTILPESLQMLCIKTEWDDDVEDELHNLAEDCPSSFPLLKQVTCVWRPAPRGIAESLIQTFQDCGIELSLDITDVQEPEPWRTETQSPDLSISGD